MGPELITAIAALVTGGISAIITIRASISRQQDKVTTSSSQYLTAVTASTEQLVDILNEQLDRLTRELGEAKTYTAELERRLEFAEKDARVWKIRALDLGWKE